MTTAVQMLDAAQVQRLSEDIVAFLETNVLPAGLFHADVFRNNNRRRCVVMVGRDHHDGRLR